MAAREVHPFEFFGGPKEGVSSGVADFGPNITHISEAEADPDNGYAASRSTYGRAGLVDLDDIEPPLEDLTEPPEGLEELDSSRVHEDPIIDDEGKDSPRA